MKRAPLSYYANIEIRGIITIVPYFDFQKDYFRWVCNHIPLFYFTWVCSQITF